MFSIRKTQHPQAPELTKSYDMAPIISPGGESALLLPAVEQNKSEPVNADHRMNSPILHKMRLINAVPLTYSLIIPVKTPLNKIIKRDWFMVIFTS